MTAHFFTGQVPPPQSNSHPHSCPLDIVQSADERIAIAVSSDKPWRIIAEAIGRLVMATDERFAQFDLLAVVRSRQLDHRGREQLGEFATSHSNLEVSFERA